MTGTLAPADLILRSGALHTMDARGRVVEALAAGGGRIVAVGTDRQVLRHRGPRTKVVALPGDCGLPACGS